jgi:hypothetical protein
LVNAGDGTFTSIVDIPDISTSAPGNYPALVAADIDGDGIPDLVNADISTTLAGVIRFRKGLADGGFELPDEYLAGLFANGVAAGVFRRNGSLDLAVVDEGSNLRMSFLVGNGNGTFAAPFLLYDGGPNSLYFPTSLTVPAVGDFDGDGVLDLAISNYTDDAVRILLGRGNGTFDSLDPFPVNSQPMGAVAAVALADLDRDGRAEVALVYGNYPTGPAQIGIMWHSDAGGLLQPVPIGTTGQRSSLYVADLNNDGAPDLVVLDGERGVRFYINACGAK